MPSLFSVGLACCVCGHAERCVRLRGEADDGAGDDGGDVNPYSRSGGLDSLDAGKGSGAFLPGLGHDGIRPVSGAVCGQDAAGAVQDIGEHHRAVILHREDEGSGVRVALQDVMGGHGAREGALLCLHREDLILQECTPAGQGRCLGGGQRREVGGGMHSKADLRLCVGGWGELAAADWPSGWRAGTNVMPSCVRRIAAASKN